MSTSQFYDDIADFYDLIYPDWERSMARQGEAIDNLLQKSATSVPRDRFRVLDVSAGIGTQALPLAKLGYDVTARDLSSKAIARLSDEALKRGLSIDASAADMRTISDSVEGHFDAVLALDNSIPHLQSDAEIQTTFGDLLDLLAPGGHLIISVRDYAGIDRTPVSSHPYGERTRAEHSYRLGQIWTWTDPTHYQATMVVEEYNDGRWTEIIRSDAMYYAIPIPRLLELMTAAGFPSCHADRTSFVQPILVGQRAV